MARNAGAFLFANLLAVVSGVTAADAQAVRGERVAITGPESPTVIEGSVKGYVTVEYQVGAAAGDTLAVALSADNPLAYFNLYAPGDVPGEATAMFIGVRDGLEYRDELTETGDYTAHVVLMRPAARREETANFSLTVEVSAVETAAAASTEPATPDAPRAESPQVAGSANGRPLNVTGQLPCAVSSKASTLPCAFRASGLGRGTAKVFVRLANGDEREILFVGGHPVASDRLGAPFDAIRDGKLLLVSVGQERYEIPFTGTRGY
jgi:hypothetical protein